MGNRNERATYQGNYTNYTCDEKYYVEVFQLPARKFRVRRVKLLGLSAERQYGIRREFCIAVYDQYKYINGTIINIDKFRERLHFISSYTF